MEGFDMRCKPRMEFWELYDSVVIGWEDVCEEDSSKFTVIISEIYPVVGWERLRIKS